MNTLIFRTVVVVLLLSAVSSSDWSQVPYDRILPVDEGTKDASFASYRRQLIRAARAADLPKVFAMVDRDVRWNEDLARGGVGEFRRYWQVDRTPKNVLKALLQALEGGGRFDSDGQFIAPYVWTDFPYDDTEMSKYIVVVSESVPVYPSADATTKPLTHVSYALLRSGGWGPDGWYHLSLNDGRSGYLRSADARRASDVRAFFRKVNGSWKLVVLAQGID